MDKLTPRKQQFCQQYLIDLNATQAAIRTGYSEKTAGSQGERLLKKVEIQTEITRLQGVRAERCEISADDALQRVFALADSNVFPILDALEHHTVDQLPKSAQKCVKSVRYKRIEKEAETIVEYMVTMHDKIQPLQLLWKHLGLIQSDAEAIATLTTYGKLTRTENGFHFEYADCHQQN